MRKPLGEQFKTLKNVFDNHTERQIFALISKGLFEGLESPISIGKEANVFSARTTEDERVIVKIYRIMAADFNRMYEYIRTDPRFEGLRNNRRKVIFAWVQREFRNLMIARDAGVTVPTPLAVGTNVLVMEHIGDADVAAPKLKDAIPEDLEGFYGLLAEELRKLYRAGLVHGDLSPFNILNFDEKPVLIDLSSATPVDDAHSEDFLRRDLENLAKFFTKHGYTVNWNELFSYVTT